MKLLIVGGGGREHALAWKLQQSPRVEAIFCAPGNAGTAALGENIPLLPNDSRGLVRFAKENQIGLTVVGPDDPLAAGLVDDFQKENLRIFGPTKAAARLEGSKVFAKQLMRCAGVPTAMAGVFDDSRKACRFSGKLHYPVVIKADGLAAGKGVVIAPDAASAAEAISDMIDRRRFGEAGARVLIEEFLEGWECSLHVLVAGDKYQLLGTACDHKRLQDGNRGPNTGGMGAYSPALGCDADLEKQFHERIMRPLLRALREEKIHFSGLLFPGLMISSGIARVLEFNCRFGDPETQVILPRLKGDLLPLLEATIDGRIDEVKIDLDERRAVTVVMASAGYPGHVEAGKKISGLDACAQMKNVHIFHAGTRRENGGVFSSGGRVLAVTALGDTMAAARDLAYQAVGKIDFAGCHYRRDIALAAVAANVEATDAASRPQR
ncbi:MAG TPA: phosphoribosylamine--glycine ligase [Chthoniobacterales bacterium]|nr:phosphoribosylamine--glycine ligase [Chthoniobacterales bacterium]